MKARGFFNAGVWHESKVASLSATAALRSAGRPRGAVPARWSRPREFL